ncbi:MAG: hypothetical protein WAX89_06700 [Alphaproteobacteria bacterium]
MTSPISTPLAYGENPHQTATFTPNTQRYGVGTAQQLQGKPLSYNNIADASAAYELVAEFTSTPACAIIKHTNPCGVAEGATLLQAYQRAIHSAGTDAFGGIIAFNHPLDVDVANLILSTFTEVVIAPHITPLAGLILSKKPQMRVLAAGGLPNPREPYITSISIAAGILTQQADTMVVDDMPLHVVTHRAPTVEEMADLKMAYRIVKHAKSNAIVLAANGATVGIGCGQTSRVQAVHVAADKAAQLGCTSYVMASNAFFPFPDGVEQPAAPYATAVIQPGGSKRDAEVIAAANARNMAMVFTGYRHFKHA